MSDKQEKDSRSEHSHTVISRIWLWLQSILYLFTFMLILFLPAGRLDWIAGWTLFGLFLLAVGLIAVWLRRHDPDLMKERQTAFQAENVESWDRAIIRGYTILLLLMLILAAVDAGRFGWSQVPMVVRAFGWLGLGVAIVIVWWVMAENTYLSESVRIQAERGHQVITTGPYQFVRHPMYLGVIFAVLSIPLALGSWWALVPAFLIVILFIDRTAMEDRTLMLKLNGYNNYAEQVPYRLLPWIW